MILGGLFNVSLNLHEFTFEDEGGVPGFYRPRSSHLKSFTALTYNSEKKCIEVPYSLTYYEGNNKNIIENFLENEIEALLSHETIHGVLHKIQDFYTSMKFDWLGETIGNTLISYPHSSTQTASEEVKSS